MNKNENKKNAGNRQLTMIFQLGPQVKLSWNMWRAHTDMRWMREQPNCQASGVCVTSTNNWLSIYTITKVTSSIGWHGTYQSSGGVTSYCSTRTISSWRNNICEQRTTKQVRPWCVNRQNLKQLIGAWWHNSYQLEYSRQRLHRFGKSWQWKIATKR